MPYVLYKHYADYLSGTFRSQSGWPFKNWPQDKIKRLYSYKKVSYHDNKNNPGHRFSPNLHNPNIKGLNR